MIKPADPRNGGWASFNRCWPWLHAALLYFGPTREKEHVWAEIYARKSQFWPGKNCAILTRIDIFPAGLCCGNAWAAGGNLKEIKQLVPQIEAWLKAQGCKKIIIMGREGWERALDGYAKLGVRLVKDV